MNRRHERRGVIRRPGLAVGVAGLLALLPGSARGVETCPGAAPVVWSEGVRSSFSGAEWMTSEVRVTADGTATVASRLSSRRSRALDAEVTVVFLGEHGERLALVARTYRLAGRSATASTTPRLRAGAMQLRLDPAIHCRLARVRITQLRRKDEHVR